MDWFDFLAVQGTLESSTPLLETISSLTLSLLYGPTLTSLYDYWKNHSFDNMDICRQSKALPLLFNMLSMFVIAFLLKNKCPLISWLQSPSTVILEPPELKSVTLPTFPPSICHEVMGLDARLYQY